MLPLDTNTISWSKINTGSSPERAYNDEDSDDVFRDQVQSWINLITLLKPGNSDEIKL